MDIRKYICYYYFKVRPCRTTEKPPKVDITNYLDGNKINYGRLLTDEVLAVDRLLVKAAKKNMDVAGNNLFEAILFYLFKVQNNFIKFIRIQVQLL